jgi:hypothetical protein
VFKFYNANAAFCNSRFLLWCLWLCPLLWWCRSPSFFSSPPSAAADVDGPFLSSAK